MGLVLWMDPEQEFSVVYEHLIEKFQASAAFFQFDKPIAVKFEGKHLTQEETTKVIEKISEITSLQIVYIIQEDIAVETKFYQAMMDEEMKKQAERQKKLQKLQEEEEEDRRKKENAGMFYKGTLRSGQTITSDTSLVILGDVNPGATVSAVGNVVVLGALKGYAYAGIQGNDNSFIVALEMRPMQLRIGNLIARNSDEETKNRFQLMKKKKKAENMEPQMAFVDEGQIYVEPISKSLFHNLMI